MVKKVKIKPIEIKKKIIRYKDGNGKWVEQEVEVKIYEPKKDTENKSLAQEILDSVESNPE